jgi:hypothetical protein
VPPWSTFPQAPLRSRTVGFPQAGAALGCPLVAFPYRAKLKRCPTYPPARSGWLPRALPCSPALQGLGTPEAAQCPEPLCPWTGFPCPVLMSRTMAVGLPPLSSLLRAHAPGLLPPRASVGPCTPGLCRLRSAPAGRRTFPTLSRRLCPCGLGPLPRPRVAGLYPLRPPRPRPAPRADRVGAQQSPYSACRTAPLSRLQSLLHGQARRCARPPERSSRYGRHRLAAVPFPSEHRAGCSLPTPRICLPSESGNGRQRTFPS